MSGRLPDCPAGEEAQPAGNGYVCGPADLPNWDHLPVTGPDVVVVIFAVALVLLGIALYLRGVWQ